MLASSVGESPLMVDQLTELFRLLSDRTRLSILIILQQGEQNVTALCETLGLPQPTVSHHLGLLRMNSLIANRRSGKQVFYGLDGRFDRAIGRTLSIAGETFSVKIEPRVR